MPNKKIALFIDADNISPKFGKQIIETLASRGEIFIRRIYGNWEKNSLHGWKECILNFSLRAVQQPDYVAGKNATDMSLTIDAMDILYGGKAEVFALISNDSDFTPLAIRLREGGMKIIGMGNSQAAISFRTSCDEFIELDAPAEVETPAAPKKKVAPPVQSPVQINLFEAEEIPKPAQIVTSPKVISISDNKLQRLHDVLHEAATIHGDEDGFLMLNRAGLELKNKKLGFGVKDFGYNQLKDFLAAFPNLYELKGSGATIYYRCKALTFKPTKLVADDKFQNIHNVLRETAQAHGDSSGFANLSWAGDAIGKKNLSIKGSGHGNLSKFVAAFPNLYECKIEANGTFYRCR